jgi:DNA-directed RNA polymerase specialized sigma24 family protein
MGNIEDSTMGGHSQRAMTYAEIATELGLTVNQVRGAEFTALRKLKHNLALRKLWAIVRAA